jgi:hypothetical protein
VPASDAPAQNGLEPMHDHHDRRHLVIEAIRHRLVEEPHRLLALGPALSLDHVVGVG